VPRVYADEDARRIEHLRILTEDVFPWLGDPKPIRDDIGRLSGYRAYAPCHADTSRSLTVSIGHDKPVVWNCFACRDRLVARHGQQAGNDEAQRLTRNALIERGVPVSALAWSAGEATSFAEKCERLLKDGVSGPWFKLWVAAFLESYDELPAGAALERLAEKSGCSRAEAFKARRASRDYRYLPPAS
jgi:hypothetical protein